MSIRILQYLTPRRSRTGEAKAGVDINSEFTNLTKSYVPCSAAEAVAARGRSSGEARLLPRSFGGAKEDVVCPKNTRETATGKLACCTAQG